MRDQMSAGSAAIAVEPAALLGNQTPKEFSFFNERATARTGIARVRAGANLLQGSE